MIVRVIILFIVLFTMTRTVSKENNGELMFFMIVQMILKSTFILYICNNFKCSFNIFSSITAAESLDAFNELGNFINIITEVLHWKLFLFTIEISISYKANSEFIRFLLDEELFNCSLDTYLAAINVPLHWSSTINYYK